MATSEEEDLDALRAEVARLQAELDEELARPYEEAPDGAVEAAWAAFPFAEQGQGLLPECRGRRGPLTTVWKAYFEATMPGGLKSTALLNFANRSSYEIQELYPSAPVDWRHKVLEMSVELFDACYANIKTHLAAAEGKNHVANDYFQSEIQLGYPNYPYHVEEHMVTWLGTTYLPRATQEILANSINPEEPMDDIKKGNMMKQAQASSKSAVIARVRKVCAACVTEGTVEEPYVLIGEDQRDKYEAFKAPYRNHVAEHLEGAGFPVVDKVKSGLLLSLYEKQDPIRKFTPTKLARKGIHMPWWFSQRQGAGTDGATCLGMLTDLVAWVVGNTMSAGYDAVRDFSGAFVQSRGWLLVADTVEAIVYWDEPNGGVLFLLLNPETDEPVANGFARYRPSEPLHHHCVLLATQGQSFLKSFARGAGSAKATKAILNSIDLSKVQRM